MDTKELRKKVIREEIDINSQENFFSKLIKGLMVDLTGSVKVRDKAVPHMIINTGDDIMYLEQKGQDMSIEPKEVSNEDYIYNRIPRGVITPGGVNLLTDQLTSPYTRGQLQFEHDGQLYNFTAEFRRMPLTMSVTVKYYLDSFTDSLELLQYVITHLNFIRNFQIVYMGQSIPCSYKFPETLDEEFNAEFDGLSQDSKYKTLEVQLEVESNLPVYYPRTAIEGSNIISGETLWLVEWEEYDTESGAVGTLSKTFYDKNEAFQWAKEHNGYMHRASKTIWNKTPEFIDGKLVNLHDTTEQRFTEHITKK